MGRPRVKTSEAPQAAGAGLAGVGVSLPRTPGHTHAIEGPRGHAQAQPAQGQGLSTPRILGGTIARSPRALDATAKIAAWVPAPWDYAEGNLNKDKTAYCSKIGRVHQKQTNYNTFYIFKSRPAHIITFFFFVDIFIFNIFII